MRARVLLQIALALLIVGVACKKKDDAEAGDIDEFITGVTAVGTSTPATQHSGAPPSAVSNGPTATITGNANTVNGGSNAYTVSGSVPTQQVIVSVGNVSGDGNGGGGGLSPSAVTNAATDADGFWQLDLPAAVSTVQLIVSFGRDIPASKFDIRVQIANAAGAVGTAASITQTVLAAGTGDVQVTATWDAASDVDLHVQEPNGNEVFWQAPTSSTGGALDLDSNPGCVIDNRNAENIRWPAGQAPSGTYTVRLHYFDDCGVGQTNFVVTVNNSGDTQVFTGSFVGNGPQDGTSGGKGQGRQITTFTHAASNALGPVSDLFFGNQPLRNAPVPSALKLRIARERR
jgi:hypothetical protein